MKKHWQYAKYVFRHKWYVFVECCKLGIPLRGVLHDLSKFRPDEWCPYVEWFYGTRGDDMPIKRDAFSVAWLKHIHRNKHHWQWWVLLEDSGSKVMMDMDDTSRKEMIADWRGAGKAITGKDNTSAWYEANKERMSMTESTRRWVEEQIKEVS